MKNIHGKITVFAAIALMFFGIAASCGGGKGGQTISRDTMSEAQLAVDDYFLAAADVVSALEATDKKANAVVTDAQGTAIRLQQGGYSGAEGMKMLQDYFRGEGMTKANDAQTAMRSTKVLFATLDIPVGVETYQSTLKGLVETYDGIVDVLYTGMQQMSMDAVENVKKSLQEDVQDELDNLAIAERTIKKEQGLLK